MDKYNNRAAEIFIFSIVVSQQAARERERAIRWWAEPCLQISDQMLISSIHHLVSADDVLRELVRDGS